MGDSGIPPNHLSPAFRLKIKTATPLNNAYQRRHLHSGTENEAVKWQFTTELQAALAHLRS